MSTPSNWMPPAVGFSSRTSSRPSVVLPEPDSPTRPSTEPRGTARSTPLITSRSGGRPKQPVRAAGSAKREAAGAEQDVAHADAHRCDVDRGDALPPQLSIKRRRHRAQRLGRPVGARRRREQRRAYRHGAAAPARRRSRPPRARGRHGARSRVRQSFATTPRSWVTNSTAAPWRCCRSLDQLQHLALHGDVERRGRLVGDDQARHRRRTPSRSARAGACRRRSRADRGRAPAAARGSRPRRAARRARASAVALRQREMMPQQTARSARRCA